MSELVLSFVFPTYNEAGNVTKLIKSVQSIVSAQKIIYEIVIVDDNSPDKTADVVQKGFGKDPTVKLVVRTTEKGFASAILSGIKASSGRYIITFDTDKTSNLEFISQMIDKLTTFDLVIASRFIKGGGSELKDRYIISLLYNKFLNLLGYPSTDATSCFYAVRKDKLEQLPLEKIYQGYGEYFFRFLKA